MKYFQLIVTKGILLIVSLFLIYEIFAQPFSYFSILGVLLVVILGYIMLAKVG